MVDTSAPSADLAFTFANVLFDVEVVDNDTAGVLLTESDGDTVVVKNAPPITPDEQDSYTLRLTKAPEAAVRIDLLTDGQTDVVLGGRVTLEELAETSFSGSVTFAANVPGGAPADPDAIIRTGGGSWLAEGFLEGQTIRVKVGAATADFKIERIGGTAERLERHPAPARRRQPRRPGLRREDGGNRQARRPSELRQHELAPGFTITVQADLDFVVGPTRRTSRSSPSSRTCSPNCAARCRSKAASAAPTARWCGHPAAEGSERTIPRYRRAAAGEREIDVLNIFDDSSQEDKVGVLTSTQLTGFGLPDELDFGIENVLGEPGDLPRRHHLRQGHLRPEYRHLRDLR